MTEAFVIPLRLSVLTASGKGIPGVERAADEAVSRLAFRVYDGVIKASAPAGFSCPGLLGSWAHGTFAFRKDLRIQESIYGIHIHNSHILGAPYIYTPIDASSVFGFGFAS